MGKVDYNMVRITSSRGTSSTIQFKEKVNTLIKIIFGKANGKMVTLKGKEGK